MDQLSSYELLDLLTTYASATGEHFMSFLGVFSAYLVAGYLVAGKLGRTTLILITVLYITVILITAITVYSTVSISIDLANEIAARDLSRTPNLTPTAEMLGGTSGEIMKVANPLIQLIACLGSIIFVFQRHRYSVENMAPDKAINSDA